MNMIEKAAKAAYQRMIKRLEAEGNADVIPATSQEELYLSGDWDAQPQILRDDWIDSTRAAMEAMREPSENMILAACVDAKKEQVRPVAINRMDADNCWRAMIDEALKEDV